jgi:hypothetical protein
MVAADAAMKFFLGITGLLLTACANVNAPTVALRDVTVVNVIDGSLRAQQTVLITGKLGLAESLGSVEVGKIADLVLLDANPLTDIRNTQRIRAVIADGRLYERTDLDRLLQNRKQ